MVLKLLRLLFVPFSALVVIAARFGLPIRFGAIFSERIGHMAGNVECYLCERDAGISRGWDFWHHNGKPCNKQLAAMIERVVRVDHTGFIRICSLINQLFSGWERNTIRTAQEDRDILNLYEKQPPHLEFTALEEARGEYGLRKMGIPPGAKWVCLIVRDAAYLPELAYHAYRDCDVETYNEAARILASRGYYVVRMGAKVEKPWSLGAIVGHRLCIDYATHGRSDFMDIYLGAHCEFAISSGCGIDAIPAIFRRPVCYTNYVPLEYLCTFNNGSLAIWKHHMKDGKRMTVAEIVASGAGHFQRAEEFEQAGITLVDNTPEEIKTAALEMADGFNVSGFHSYGGTGTELLNQSAFWRTFPRSVSTYNGRPLHGAIRMRIGQEFLKGYQ